MGSSKEGAKRKVEKEPAQKKKKKKKTKKTKDVTREQKCSVEVTS